MPPLQQTRIFPSRRRVSLINVVIWGNRGIKFCVLESDTWMGKKEKALWRLRNRNSCASIASSKHTMCVIPNELRYSVSRQAVSGPRYKPGYFFNRTIGMLTHNVATTDFPTDPYEHLLNLSSHFISPVVEGAFCGLACKVVSINICVSRQHVLLHIFQTEQKE